MTRNVMIIDRRQCDELLSAWLRVLYRNSIIDTWIDQSARIVDYLGRFFIFSWFLDETAKRCKFRWRPRK